MIILLVFASSAGSPTWASRSSPQADDPNPPAAPVKLIFVHHSTGGNWLADVGVHESAGGLGRALMNNNYYVSATNYGWTAGEEAIGDNTDIGHWWSWFRGANSATILNALYDESGQNFGDYGAWPRLATDPGGENEIIMFKSCFPNSHLGGNPDDAPTTGDNPLRGQDAWAGDSIHNVANAKGIYNDLLTYFATRQDKLFIAITAPPLLENDEYQPTDAAHAANARAFNDWLVNDWLDAYPHDNVAVFDFYNVLTSNGGNPNSNDAGVEAGNHHRWWSGAVQHIHSVSNNFSAYGIGTDSHPTGAGGQKASAEFVQLLNVYYNRWQPGGSSGGTYTFNAVISPGDASPPVTYTWSPAPTSGQGTASATYQWSSDDVYEIAVEVENCGGTFTDTHTVTVGTPLVSDLQARSETAVSKAPAQQTMAFQDGVSPNASYAGTTDVVLARDVEDNANVGGLESLQTYFGDTEDRRSLVRWDLAALPDGVTVEAATLELYRYHVHPENEMQLALYRVTSNWVEGTGVTFWPEPSYVPNGATWLTATTSVAWTTPGGDFDSTVLDQVTLPTGTSPGWLRLDATSAVQAWAQGSHPNYGLLLRPLNGEWTDYQYHSREAVTTTLRPRLVVTYSTGAGTSLALTAPTGSASWPVSSTQQIRWNTTGTVAEVNLYYSSDNFVTRDTIASGIDNSGVHPWTTPLTPTQSARVRVESVISPTTVYDVSDPFTLYAGVAVYLPLVLKNLTPCTYPLTGVVIQPATAHAKSDPTGVVGPLDTEMCAFLRPRR